MVQVCRDLKAHWQVRAIPGVELTHIPPDLISPLTVRARTLGAQIVLVHGETIVEPVPPGTNQQAIAAGVDILAHPGLIAEEEVVLAREKGVFLEITARKGHSLTNGHVARLAKKVGASLVLNTDTHAPDDLISQDYALKIALGAGLTNEDFERMQENAWKILDRMS
jgi:histidinol phosphatase-like PHP family hydrolase